MKLKSRAHGTLPSESKLRLVRRVSHHAFAKLLQSTIGRLQHYRLRANSLASFVRN